MAEANEPEIGRTTQRSPHPYSLTSKGSKSTWVASSGVMVYRQRGVRKSLHHGTTITATHLNHHGPLDVTALVDGLVQVSLRVVWVLTHGDVGLVHGKGLDRLVEPPVVLSRSNVPTISYAVRTYRTPKPSTHLDKSTLALGVDPSESVTSISVKVMGHGRSVVGQQHQPSVLRFGNVGEEIEPSVVVDQEGLGVTLLRSNVVGTLERVPLGRWVGRLVGHSIVSGP